ncbi:DNA polymerase III subunit gamma/tau [Idiomarina seosinensis]|uniref:DNA polymerase III subunit gamma/tau n=1 Tax=Idiomarina seosinensis TaxID=281739 RepID=UPI00384FEC56
MSYQVLARKWRPAQFSQVVGQQHVLRPLQHALENNRLHHAYLFTGTRGVGKTSIARLLAKALNCETGVTSQPCGECQTCRDIEQGRFVDLLEIDAASRTKVEDTRELLDNVQYRPTQGRFKVYLIDEVHMLSRHSFNALLKTLEEPPEHVKFLLATTDPQKLPVTVVSRCLQFNLRALTQDLISEQLRRVLGEEGINADNEALRLIARAASGSMRDGLSLTDQAIAQGAGAVQLESVQQMLGNVPRADVVGLLDAISDGEANKAFNLFEQMSAVVPDISVLLTELQALLHRLALIQQIPSLATEEEQQTSKSLLRKLPAEVIQLYYRLVIEGRKEQPFAVDERAGVEMTLLRLLAFKPMSDDGLVDLGGEPDSPATNIPTPPEPVAEVSSEPGPASDLDDLLKMREQLASAQQRTESSVPTDFVSTDSNEQKKKPEVGQSLADDLAAQLPEFNEQIRKAEQVDDWAAMIAAMELNGLSRQLLLNSNLRKISADQWQIGVASAQQSLVSEATVQAVTEAMRDMVSRQGNFEVVVEEPGYPTPLMIQQSIDAYRHQLAVQWIHTDAGINELKQRFAAQVVESSISAV